MGTGSVTNVSAVAVPLVPLRPDLSAPRGSVRTELAPQAAVIAVAENSQTRFDLTRDAQARQARDLEVRSFIDRNLTVDPKTREIIFQAVDRRTGEVVRQFPNDMALKLRAYYREMSDKSGSSPAAAVVRSA